MDDFTAQYEKKRLEEYTQKLKKELRELFQIGDAADLDFGMYRVMHQKRQEVENFIEHALGEKVDEAFGTYAEDARTASVKERENIERLIREDVDEHALGPDGIHPQYLNTKHSRELDEQWHKLREIEKQASMSDQHKAEIFTRITEFFSRYYKDGDFLSLPRYSRKEKYSIPYNGEEVYLYWANKDQYYIKTDIYLNNYAFDAGIYKVSFEITAAESQVNNTKGGNLFLLLKGNDAISYDKSLKLLTIRFERRSWNTDELRQWLPESANKDKPSKGDIWRGIANEVLSTIKENGLKEALNRSAYPDRAGNSTTILEKHVERFTNENTFDFFIHKDLGEFLRRELDFYMKNEVVSLDDLGTEKEASIEAIKLYMNRARIIKQICLQIIDFLAQMEDFQKMLFEKKKFVLATDYCVTLDYLPEELYPLILENKKQLDEWKVLFDIGDEEQLSLGMNKKGISLEYLKNHPYLVVDTKYFDTFVKEHLLASLRRPDGSPIEDLDKEIGGLIVHSENWQALNLFKEKYSGQIKCSFIDPPYNTGNDEFLYKDNYQYSSWLTMMSDRLAKGRQILQDDSAIFITIDDNEVYYLRMTLNNIFGDENFVDCIIWQKKVSPSNDAKWFSSDHDYILVYAKSKNIWRPIRLPMNERQIGYYKNPDNDSRGPWNSSTYTCNKSKEQRPNLYYPIKNPNTGEEVLPKTTAVWAYSKEQCEEHKKNNLLYWGADGKSKIPRLKLFLSGAGNVVPRSIWPYTDVGNTQEATREFLDLFPEGGFSTPKPTRLIKRIIQLGTTCKNGDIILDFFAGSGTTANAVLSLNKQDNGNRKYILIEMGDYFNTIIKPRIKKIIFASEWKDGKPVQGSEGQSHIFKYQTFEQYEDTLDNIVFLNRDGTTQRTLNRFSDYMLHYMLDFESRTSHCRLNMDSLNKPFNYTLKIRRKILDTDHLRCIPIDGDSHGWDVKVDLVETFNYLLGVHVKRLESYDTNKTHYLILHGTITDGSTITVVWRDCSSHDFDYKDDEAFIQGTILRAYPAGTVYINGKFFVKGALPIEPKFKELMGA